MKNSHSALIRIEDVSPMENPDRLRDIADILSSRNNPVPGGRDSVLR